MKREKIEVTDAIDFYHMDECSDDIYEAMEQFAKFKVTEVEAGLNSVLSKEMEGRIRMRRLYANKIEEVKRLKKATE